LSGLLTKPDHGVRPASQAAWDVHQDFWHLDEQWDCLHSWRY
jgi:hypothetical protein